MDTEFHYWLTGLIAKHSGFTDEESRIIAYSSEYVDENDVIYYIKNRSGKGTYSNFISQTMNILKPKHDLMRIYPVFHFIPGEPNADTARRRDGKMHLLNTTPNSENANEIIDAAFKSHEDVRLYRIGISSHAYVDTWAHQNFVGWYDAFNNIGLDPKPDIGHADGEHHPDWVSHIWIDERLVESDISNRNRFLSAGKALFEKYCQHLNATRKVDNSANWELLERELIEIMGPTYTGNKIRYEEQRQASYTKRMNWLGDGFDEREWFDDAIETKVRGLRDSEDGLGHKLTLFQDEYYWRDSKNKQQTHWYRFQEAVKEHEKAALKLLSPRFARMGIDLTVC